MVKITKNNYKKFSKRNLLPNADGSKPNSEQANNMFRKMQELLDKFSRDYSSLRWLRDYRARCVRYYFGRQLEDVIPNPNGCGNITEEEYMMQQGISPMSMNVIRKQGKSFIGIYRKSKKGPMAISRDREHQKEGEMMTVALEYVYQNRFVEEINARGYEEAVLSSIPCFRVGYDWDSRRKMSDVKVNLSDINRMAWDDNTSGLYFENISRIGYLHDMTIGDVLSRFAHSPRDKQAIEEIYKSCRQQFGSSNQQFQKDDRKRHLSFYEPLDPDMCRVIEIWQKEPTECWACHDTAKGETWTVPLSDEEGLIAENRRRQMEMMEAGGAAENAALIEYEYRVDEKWVARYLTPNAYVLKEEEEPYWHGSHPWAIGAFPLVDGEIHSTVDDAINPQRMVNRLMMRNEFLRMNDAKGITLVNKRILDRTGIDLNSIAKQLSSPNAVVAMEWEPGEEPLHQYNGSSTNSNDVHMLDLYLKLMDDVTGSHEAMRGESPNSSTPASLYAQEADNATNNIADLMEWYNGLILERDYKIMSVIQQFYTERRYLNIAGKDYSEEAKMYDPQKVRNTKFDLVLVNASSTGMMRLEGERLLNTVFNSNMTPDDRKTYLECSPEPLADKVLERIKAREREQADAAAQMMQEQAAQQPQLAQAVMPQQQIA